MNRWLKPLCALSATWLPGTGATLADPVWLPANAQQAKGFAVDLHKPRTQLPASAQAVLPAGEAPAARHTGTLAFEVQP